MEHDDLILSAQLTADELNCLDYCQTHSDCVMDGECELQEHAADIIANENEVAG